MAPSEKPSTNVARPSAPQWRSEAREWYLAGGLLMGSAALLSGAIITTRFWEFNSTLYLAAWAFGTVASLVAGMGALFLYQGFIRRRNPALLVRKIRGEQVSHGMSSTLKENYDLVIGDLKVWPSLGYWKGVARIQLLSLPEPEGAALSRTKVGTAPDQAQAAIEIKEIWFQSLFYGTQVALSPASATEEAEALLAELKELLLPLIEQFHQEAKLRV